MKKIFVILFITLSLQGCKDEGDDYSSGYDDGYDGSSRQKSSSSYTEGYLDGQFDEQCDYYKKKKMMDAYNNMRC
jgi:hypothetical protein